MPDFVDCRRTLALYLKARVPFISLRTDERDRALDLFRQAIAELNVPVYFHTLSHGMRDLATNRVVSEDRSVPGALDYASQQMMQRQNLTFILTEAPDIADDTPSSRQLLDVASSATDRGGCVAAITTSGIWGRLQRQGMTLTLDTPNEDEMRTIVAECLEPYRGGMRIEWGDDDIAQRLRAVFLRQAPDAGELDVRLQLRRRHRGGLDGGQIVFADPAEVFPGDGPDCLRRFFSAETFRQIVQHHAAVTAVEAAGQRPQRAPQPGDEPQRQRLNQRDERPANEIKQRVHISGNRFFGRNPESRWRRRQS